MTTVRATKMLPPVWFAISLVAMAALHVIAPIAGIIPSRWNWIGVPLIVGGVVVTISGVRLFLRHRTGIIPFSPSTSLVTSGPYRFTRNPMYVGMVLALAGVAVTLGTLAPWVVIPIFAWWIRRRFIAHEETMMAETFGEEYVQYKRRVRRWM
ncbi:MAG: hypothetical protein QOE14_1458 [Humisphaera sp.]|nr:hypothetical protein [Humisphaera sp.]